MEDNWEPLVSIIMPVYNCEGTVREAIDSILNQTHQNIMLIICDDCSTDGTYKIIERYQKEFPSKVIVLRNEKNQKLHYSLNHCLRYADGMYIARMDGDDISERSRIEKQVAFLQAHPEYAEVGCGYIRFDEEGEFGKVMSPQIHDRKQMKYGVPSCHACIMMRREVYDAIQGYTVSKRTERCEDLDMWYRFYAAGFQGANLQEYLYKVRDNRAALQRRKFRYDLDAVKTNLIGFKMLNYPVYLYPLAFRQIVSHLIPYRVKVALRNIQAKKRLDC